MTKTFPDVPSTCETCYPFINLNLGMHVLFPSTYPHPRLTIKCPNGPSEGPSAAANASVSLSAWSGSQWVNYPVTNWSIDSVKLPASLLGFKMLSQFGGHFCSLCPSIPGNRAQLRLVEDLAITVLPPGWPSVAILLQAWPDKTNLRQNLALTQECVHSVSNLVAFRSYSPTSHHHNSVHKHMMYILMHYWN